MKFVKKLHHLNFERPKVDLVKARKPRLFSLYFLEERRKQTCYFIGKFTRPPVATNFNPGKIYNSEKGKMALMMVKSCSRCRQKGKVTVLVGQKESIPWWLLGIGQICTLASFTIQHFTLFICNSMYFVRCNVGF